MNQEDIIRMAREAGFNGPVPADGYMGLAYDRREGGEIGGSLERFAALIAAAERDKYEAKFKQLEAIVQAWKQQPNKPCCLAEREACAKVCEERMTYWHRGDPNIYEDEMCAAAIRARGQQ